MNRVEFVFDVEVKGDKQAGLAPHTQRVKITLDGDFGGEPGEFEEHTKQSLCDWFDTPSVTRYQKPKTALDKIGDFYLNGAGITSVDSKASTNKVVLDVNAEGLIQIPAEPRG